MKKPRLRWNGSSWELSAHTRWTALDHYLWQRGLTREEYRAQCKLGLRPRMINDPTAHVQHKALTRKVEELALPQKELRPNESFPLFTTEELAQRLGVTTDLLARWRSRGGGPKFIAEARNLIVYLKSDVNAWLRKRRRERLSYPKMKAAAKQREAARRRKRARMRIPSD